MPMRCHSERRKPMKKRILSLLPLALVLAALLCAPAFALTESEVEAQVAASSK